jgi:hypothetical protein
VLRSSLLGLWETRPGGLLTRGRAEDWGECFGGAARDNGRHRRRPTRGMIRDNTALRATRWHKAIKTHRAMSHPVKHVTSGGGAASLLSIAGAAPGETPTSTRPSRAHGPHLRPSTLCEKLREACCSAIARPYGPAAWYWPSSANGLTPCSFHLVRNAQGPEPNRVNAD